MIEWVDHLWLDDYMGHRCKKKLLPFLFVYKNMF